jgi:hypothetical protein
MQLRKEKASLNAAITRKEVCQRIALCSPHTGGKGGDGGLLIGGQRNVDHSNGTRSSDAGVGHYIV